MLLSIYNIRITLIKKSSKQESASGESENKESNDDNTESRSDALIQDIYITLATDYIHYLYSEVPEELYPAFPEQYKFIPNV